MKARAGNVYSHANTGIQPIKLLIATLTSLLIVLLISILIPLLIPLLIAFLIPLLIVFPHYGIPRLVAVTLLLYLILLLHLLGITIPRILPLVGR